MKKVIGIIGEKGAGKGLCAQTIKEISKDAVVIIKSSDILADTLKIWNLHLTRHNMQQLVLAMDKEFGEDALTKAVRNRIEKAPEDITIFEGVRWSTDVEMIRTFEKSFIIYVSAPAEVRYERTKVRKEKEGEGTATFQEFMQEELVPTETQIPEVSKKADFVIENTGTMEEFKEKVMEVFSKIHI